MNLMKKCFWLIVLILSFSCSDKEVNVSGFIVEPKNLTLSKGDVVQLSYIVSPYRADNKTIAWKSNDINIATVSATGVVTAVAQGNTQIIATTNDGNFTETINVKVLRGSPSEDSIALIKLYEIAENLYWDITKPMDKWQGVVLSPGRRVLEIYWNNNIYITNQLDPSIGNLAMLKSLKLLFYGWGTHTITIPKEIGMLTELQELFFYGFTGQIPSELGNLTKLEYLYFDRNNLTGGGIPKELGNLINLKSLVFYRCNLSGSIPKELGNLTKLRELNFYYNQLSGEIPQELENLKNLIDLDLSYNYLSGNIPQYLLNRFNRWSFCPQYGDGFDNFDCGW